MRNLVRKFVMKENEKIINYNSIDGTRLSGTLMRKQNRSCIILWLIQNEGYLHLVKHL